MYPANSFVTNALALILLAAGLHIVVVWIRAIRQGLHRRNSYLKHEEPMSRNLPFISIIIPAWRERGTIDFCIESLKSIRYPSWEVVIVAGGPDGTYQAALEAGSEMGNIKVIKQHPRGKNAALNEGLDHSRGEIIVLLDADSRVSPGWLEALIAPLTGASQVTIGQPVPLRETSISMNERMERISTWEIHNSVILQGSGSIALKRELIKQMQGFPEEILVGVDWDLSARLSAQGIAFTYCPKAIVYTERPATIREYWHNEVRWRRAHFLSFFRLRSFFLANLKSIFRNLYFYFLSWFTLLFSVFAGLVVLTGENQSKTLTLTIWLIFIAWIVLRRASLAVEVAAYTANPAWLKGLWTPPILLMITFPAAVVATLTLNQNRTQFKGPRLSRGLKQAR